MSETGFIPWSAVFESGKNTGNWLRRGCDGTWVFMGHFLVLCVSIAFDSKQEHANIQHNITARDTFHNINVSHRSKRYDQSMRTCSRYAR